MDTAIFFLGFGLLALAVNSACLILGRVLLGYPLVSQVFLCEILSTDRRGMGAAMYSVLHSTGFFVVLFLGNYIYQYITCISRQRRSLSPLEGGGINPSDIGRPDIYRNLFRPRVSRLA